MFGFLPFFFALHHQHGLSSARNRISIFFLAKLIIIFSSFGSLDFSFLRDFCTDAATINFGFFVAWSHSHVFGLELDLSYPPRHDHRRPPYWQDCGEGGTGGCERDYRKVSSGYCRVPHWLGSLPKYLRQRHSQDSAAAGGRAAARARLHVAAPGRQNVAGACKVCVEMVRLGFMCNRHRERQELLLLFPIRLRLMCNRHYHRRTLAAVSSRCSLFPLQNKAVDLNKLLNTSPNSGLLMSYENSLA